MFSHRLRPRSAFTLIELLTVMAIIGLLITALVVAVGPVTKKVKRSQTRSQFSQYIAAYELFKNEYKYYPRLQAGDDRFDLVGKNDIFIQTISGKAKNGTVMTDSVALQLNKKRISFYSFQENEFSREEVDGLKGEIVDGFGNPNISVVVDSDNNGVIPSEKLPKGSTENAAQINAKVVFFSSQSATPEWEDIYSW